jgi:hypothetical protein
MPPATDIRSRSTHRGASFGMSALAASVFGGGVARDSSGGHATLAGQRRRERIPAVMLNGSVGNGARVHNRRQAAVRAGRSSWLPAGALGPGPLCRQRRKGSVRCTGRQRRAATPAAAVAVDAPQTRVQGADDERPVRGNQRLGLDGEATPTESRHRLPGASRRSAADDHAGTAFRRGVRRRRRGCPQAPGPTCPGSSHRSLGECPGRSPLRAGTSRAGHWMTAAFDALRGADGTRCIRRASQARSGCTPTPTQHRKKHLHARRCARRYRNCRRNRAVPSARKTSPSSAMSAAGLATAATSAPLSSTP